MVGIRNGLYEPEGDPILRILEEVVFFNLSRYATVIPRICIYIYMYINIKAFLATRLSACESHYLTLFLSLSLTVTVTVTVTVDVTVTVTVKFTTTITIIITTTITTTVTITTYCYLRNRKKTINSFPFQRE